MKELKRRFWIGLVWLVLGEALIVGYLVTNYYSAIPWWWALTFLGVFLGFAGLMRGITKDAIAGPIAMCLAGIFPLSQAAAFYLLPIKNHDPMMMINVCKGLLLGAIIAPVIFAAWHSFLKLEYNKTRSAYNID